MSSRSPSKSREQLIRAALHLFAAEGVEGVSIRAVNRKAGLGPASVHYHFGDKEALLDAVLHLYGDDVTDGIVEEAEKLETSSTPPTAQDVVSMVANPYLNLITEHGQEGIEWLCIINQLLTTDSQRVSPPGASDAAFRTLRSAFPDADPAVARRAHALSVRLLVSFLAQSATPLTADDPSVRAEAEQQLATLRSFLAGGITASLEETAHPHS